MRYESKEEFCAMYNREAQSIKDCWNDAAVKSATKLQWLWDGEINLGKCCAQ